MQQTLQTIAQVVGENARAVREGLGVSQEDVATCSRRLGARWSQSTVADFEQGKRTLTLPNVLLLAAALSDLGTGAPPVRLADLVHADGLVEVAEGMVVSPRMLSSMLGSEAAAQGVFAPIYEPGPDATYPDVLDEYVRAAAYGPWGLAMARDTAEPQPVFELGAGPLPTADDLLAVRSSFGLAEHRAAQRLLMIDVQAQHHMARLWGEPLGVRSDRIAGEESQGRASAQRRGGVTRWLSAELEDDRELTRALAAAAPELVDASREASREEWRALGSELDRWRALADGRAIHDLLGIDGELRDDLRGVDGIDWVTPELMARLVEEADRGEHQ